MHTAGPRLAQSASAVQTPHVLELEQTAFASGQSLLPRHSTQAPLVVEQCGVAGVSVAQVRGASGEPQDTHVPASEQNGVVGEPAQSMSLPHWTQAPLAPQTGVAGLKAAQLAFCGACLQDTQIFCAPQNGVVPPQSLSASHWTQAPLAPQTGFDGSRVLQASSFTQPAHTFLLQKDLSGVLQSPSPTHSTHRCWVGSQTAVVPVHALVLALVH